MISLAAAAPLADLARSRYGSNLANAVALADILKGSRECKLSASLRSKSSSKPTLGAALKQFSIEGGSSASLTKSKEFGRSCSWVSYSCGSFEV